MIKFGPTVVLSSLHQWDQNPRSITDKAFDRLKKHIEQLGQYKPLLVTPDGNGYYTVLGGNMRLRAYAELGIADVWVTIIEFYESDYQWIASIDGVSQNKRFKSKLDAMMEYSLSDNDRAGFYDEDMVANILPSFDIDLSDFSIDMKQPRTIDEILGNREKQQKEADPINAMVPRSNIGKTYRLGDLLLTCGTDIAMCDLIRKWWAKHNRVGTDWQVATPEEES